MRNLGLLLFAAAALGAPVGSAYGDEQPANEPIVLKGECTSSGKSGTCNQCEVALKEDLELPVSDRSLIWSCPKMAAGRYQLSIGIPVRLVPPQTTSLTLFQLSESFSAKTEDERKDLVPETHPVSWNWLAPSGARLSEIHLIEIDQDAGVDVIFKIEDPRYYVPQQTQGPAHRDGKLLIAQGEVSRLIPQPIAPDIGTVREFSDATLGKVIPGKTTKAQVEALLGQPWRTIEGDPDEPPEPLVWEYQARDSNGPYRVHVEFDDHDITTLIVKVPSGGHATARVAEPPRGPANP
jgi:hypothetical protein